jgi:hypothetical protein
MKECAYEVLALKLNDEIVEDVEKIKIESVSGRSCLQEELMPNLGASPDPKGLAALSPGGLFVHHSA